MESIIKINFNNSIFEQKKRSILQQVQDERREEVFVEGSSENGCFKRFLDRTRVRLGQNIGL